MTTSRLENNYEFNLKKNRKQLFKKKTYLIKKYFLVIKIQKHFTKINV